MKLILFCFAALISAADIDVLRLNVTNYLTGAGADTNDSVVSQSLTDLETSARTLMNTSLPRGGWSDINYAKPLALDEEWGKWQAMKHYERLLQMTVAYCTRGQKLYNSDSLKNAIELALDSIHDHVYYGVNRVNNWWYWFQGIPMYYGPTLLLMQGKMDSTLHAQAVSTLKWCLDNPEYHSNPGDMVTQGLGFLYHGIIANNVTSLNRAKTLAQGELTIRNSVGDGILADFSCVHHMNQLYIGAYGAQVAADGPKYLFFTTGTQYALSKSNVDAITGFNAEGTAWSLHHNYYDISVIGRSITRASQTTFSTYGLTAMLLMATYDGEKKSLFQRASKKMLESWDIPIPIELATYASSALSQPVVRSWPIGHKNFWMTYFTVHKRADYHISVKMMGPGITGSSYVNDEGKKSWHLSDGMTYILRKGDEYNINDVIATLDWNRLPGITVQKKTYPAGQTHSNAKAFVGGVECGAYGTSAMDFSSSGELVTAKKSWHFFDDEIVCLGSNIDCPSADTVETVINQRPIPSASEALIADGAVVSNSLPWSGKLTGIKWAFCDSIGYFFPGGADVSAKMASQSGRWCDIGVGDAITRTNNFSTLWFNHGINVNNGSYSYAVLPNKSPSDMEAYSTSPGIRVVENSDTIHAIENSALKAISVVFWNKGSINLLKSDSPSIVFCRETNDSFFFSASYPPKKAVDLKFDIDRPLTLVSSNIAPIVSTDSIRTSITFRSPGNGNGLVAIFRKISKTFGYLKVTVIDSSTGQPIQNAFCTLKKEWPNSAITNESGIAVVKADTGLNSLSVRVDGYRTKNESAIQLIANDTISQTVILSKLPIAGLNIIPERTPVALSDSIMLSLYEIYADSSTKPAKGKLYWSSLNPELATIDTFGLLKTHLTDGIASIKCSSVVLGIIATLNITIQPIYRLRPIADAFVRGGSFSSVNYGIDSLLVLKNNGDPGFTRKVYLKFNLSAIARFQIDSAVLYTYFSDAPSAKISVYKVDNDNWTESTVNWDNAPQFNGIIDTISLLSTPGWKRKHLGTYPVTQYMGDKILSLALYNDRSDDLYISLKSKESSAFAPYIEVYAHKSVEFENDVSESMPFELIASPNPFNPSTTIAVHGLKGIGEKTSISILRTNGEKVFGKTIRSQHKSIELSWNASNEASGVYIVSIKCGNKTLQKKVTLLK